MINIKNQNFGLELEFTQISRERAARAIAQVINGNQYFTHISSYDRRIVKDATGRKWSICSDASVNGSGRGNGGEFVTPICTYDDIPLVQECIRALRRAGAKVDSSCGLHIHVDGANHNAKSLKNLIYLFRAKQNLIYKAVGTRRERLGRWCKPIDEKLVENVKNLKAVNDTTIKDTWYDTYCPWGNRNAHYNDSRYHALNLHSMWYRGTVEFRLFEATLHAGEVRAYINLVLAMSAQAINAKRANPEPYENGNDKFVMRNWLRQMGFTGDEWKVVREHLMKRLEGNGAYVHDPRTYDSYNNRRAAQRTA